MSIRVARSAGWAAYVSGIAAILALVSLVLFFAPETSSPSGTHLWGPISDICPILQMVSLLVVARRALSAAALSCPGLQPRRLRNRHCRHAGSGAAPAPSET